MRRTRGSRSIRIGILLTSAGLAAAGCDYDRSLQALSVGQKTSPPDTVSVSITGYVPQPGHVFKDLFVSNFSVKASRGKLQYSSARDGMPDEMKQAFSSQYGFLIGQGPYSVNPGFSDLLLYQMGVGFSQQSLLNCADNLKNSAVNDAFIFMDKRYPGMPPTVLGLRDCEKLYLNLSLTSFDNSGSGIPDYLKIRCGMNPKNRHDARLSIAGDGVSNYDKCKQHIPIDESADSDGNKLLAYHYKHELKTDGSRDLNVNNIAILNGGKDNFLAFYLLETDPLTSAVSLYTAYAILHDGSAGAKLKFAYWATDPSRFYSQEIVQP